MTEQVKTLLMLLCMRIITKPTCLINSLKFFFCFSINFKLYLWASLLTQLVKNPPAMQETWVWSPALQVGSLPAEFDPWVRKIPWRREKLLTPVFCPGEFHGLYSPWGHKESDMTELLSLSLKLH